MKNDHLAIGLQTGEILILDSKSFTIISKINRAQEVFVLADSNTIYLVSGGVNGEMVKFDNFGNAQYSVSYGGIITCLLFLNDFILASGYDDSTIRIWDLNANRLLRSFNSESNGYPNRITKLILNQSDVAILNGKNNTIMVFDKDGNMTLMPGHTDVVNDLVLLPDNLLASASEDRVIHIWNLNTRLHKSTLVVDIAVKKVAYIFAAQLACGLENGDIEIWDYMYQKKLHVFKGHSKPITVLKRINNIFPYGYFDNLTNSTTTLSELTSLAGTQKVLPTASKNSISTPSSLNLVQNVQIGSLTNNQLVGILENDFHITNCLLNCSNHGSCVFDTSDFKCNCFEHYTGPTCEYDMRKCSTQGCLNNGTCIDLVDSYKQYDFKCECVETFVGKNCEIPIDICANITCSSNGYCVKEENKPKCKCFNYYSGESCELEAHTRTIIRRVITSSTIVAIVTISFFLILVVSNDLANVFLVKKKNSNRKKRRF